MSQHSHASLVVLEIEHVIEGCDEPLSLNYAPAT